MSQSFNAGLRELYVRVTTAAGGTPVIDSLADVAYLRLINGSMGQILDGLSTGTPGTSPARQTLTVTTPQLAPGATHLFELVTGYRTFTLVNIALSAPGRAQGYRTLAVRAADEGRAFGATPMPDGLELDALLIAGALSQAGAGLIALEADGVLYGRLTNTGGAAQVLTLQLEILPLEEAQLS